MRYKSWIQKGLTWSVTMLVLSNIHLNPALAQSGRYSDWHMGNWMMGMGYGYGGGFMWVILLILLGVVFYFLLKDLKAKGTDGPAVETPLDILKKRYAKGEIDKEKFDRMKKDLES